MIGVVSAVAPIFIIIVIGYGFKKSGFPGEGLWAPAERLSYYVLLPALILHTLAAAFFGPIAATCLLKLVVMPVVAWGILQYSGLTGLAFTIAMMMAATPSSPGTYVLARQMGGDAPLMAGIVTAETAFSAITLSAVLMWLTGKLPI